MDYKAGLFPGRSSGLTKLEDVSGDWYLEIGYGGKWMEYAQGINNARENC